MLRGKNRELSCLNEGKKGGALHHLSVIVESAQSVPYNLSLCPPVCNTPGESKGDAFPWNSIPRVKGADLLQYQAILG